MSASERVREARQNAVNAVVAWAHHAMFADERDRMVDLYVAAIRAETLAEVRGIVEEMRHDTMQPNMGAVVESGAHKAYQVRANTLHGILAALATLETPNAS